MRAPASEPFPPPLADDPRIGRRRILFWSLCILITLGTLALGVAAVAPGGFDALDIVMIVLLAALLPWSAVGLSNSIIGFLIMRRHRDPLQGVYPAARAIDPTAPITSDTALLMCVRNEDVGRVERNVAELLAELQPTGSLDRFAVHILSDTNDAAIGAEEEASVARLRQRFPSARIAYRRRLVNTGFKAGNVWDFFETQGDAYTFAITLDADSFMSARRILEMVRIAEANPRLGILQSMINALPTLSPFARIFQFGMRLGMLSWTIGSSWWQADCGPYWGHNAVIRIAAFKAHCRLDPLPGEPPFGGPILSHDQVEAAVMRRGGYEVRVIPEDGGSHEVNPPNLVEFTRRDLRWCQGNLQYLKLLMIPGLKPASRAQLLLAILMFVALPAWVVLIALSGIRLMVEGAAPFSAWPAFGVWALVIFMTYSPRIATLIDVMTKPAERATFGGGKRMLISAGIETVFSMLLWPIMAYTHTVLMIMLFARRTIGWGGQARDEHATPWPVAWQAFRGQQIAGLVIAAALPFMPLGGALMIFVVTAGLIFVVPFAVITSRLDLGRSLAKARLNAIPEEINPPAYLYPLGLSALEAVGKTRPAATPKAPATAAE